MDHDDPLKPEFVSHRSYWNFAKRIRDEQRYALNSKDKAFLNTVIATIPNREQIIPKGFPLFRAQNGVEYIEDDENGIYDCLGYGSQRMKPLKDQAKSGRVNPSGIPALYLASNIDTAISEIRPWIGAEVSVATFKIKRDIKAIDLSKFHGKHHSKGAFLFLDEENLSADEKQEAVWIDIDNAFSLPVTNSDNKDYYAPTQILSELFREYGYEAIIYKSNFGGENGYNVAVFNLDDADCLTCSPYKVDNVTVHFRQIGNAWYKS